MLNVNRKTSNIGVRSELGIFPIGIECLMTSIKYWMRLITDTPKNSLVFKAYLELHNLDKVNIGWLRHLKTVLQWLNVNTDSSEKVIDTIRANMKQIQAKTKHKYIEAWQNKLHSHDYSNKKNGNKLRNYRLFKADFVKELYLDVLQPNLRAAFAKFRLRAHKLNIESKRFVNNVWIAPADRKCNLCNSGEPQDEYHVLMNCEMFTYKRKLLYTKICQIFPNFIALDDWEKYIYMLSYGDGDSEICKLVATFIYEILYARDEKK